MAGLRPNQGNPYVVSDNETIVAAPSSGADTAFPASMIYVASYESSGRGWNWKN
jgi:hypothetical protein